MTRHDERDRRRIIDAIPHPIVVLAPDGAELCSNKAAFEYTGLSTARNSGSIHPDDVEPVRKQIERGLSEGVPFQLEERSRGKDGRYCYFRVDYRPLRDDRGGITEWYATSTNINDCKQANEQARDSSVALRSEIDSSSRFEEIVGASEPIRKVLWQVSRVAPMDSTVLILGETGTGKELIARAIQRRSSRSGRPFVSVNCAAIPPSLIASELFGHEKGAFTGAMQRHLGRFELADRGTIFLDEIGELAVDTQIALLRVLQERKFERVGGTQSISVDVRVLAATNRDLKEAVAAGAFREALYYRLHVYPIEIPTLHERKDDIPSLVEYFVHQYSKQAGKKIKRIERKTLELCQAYKWPGNIRELQNVVERGVILCDGDTFSVDETWLSSEARFGLPPRRGPATRLLRLDEDQERELIEAALAETRGRVAGPSGAARKLGIPRQTLESKIIGLGINKHRFKLNELSAA